MEKMGWGSQRQPASCTEVRGRPDSHNIPLVFAGLRLDQDSESMDRGLLKQLRSLTRQEGRGLASGALKDLSIE